jgi:hypothetical protein
MPLWQYSVNSFQREVRAVKVADWTLQAPNWTNSAHPEKRTIDFPKRKLPISDGLVRP